VCDRAFFRAGALQSHRRVHSGEELLAASNVHEERLTEHSAKSNQTGCDLIGNSCQTNQDAKSCFYHRSIGCGLCGNIYWTEQDAKCCFYEHKLVE